MALSRCKGGPEKALFVVKGRIKGPMQMETAVVVQEDERRQKIEGQLL